jgi:hypothetical protein
LDNIADLEYFTVNEDGTQTSVGSFDKDSTKVYIIVDHKGRMIYLWKGLKAGVRLKFIGSRSMGDTRKSVGFHYKIDVNDEEDETRTFRRDVLGDEAAGTGAQYEEGGVPSYAEAAAAQGIVLSDEELKAKAVADAQLPGHVAKMGGITSRPQKSFLADEGLMTGQEPSAETTAPKPVSKRQTKQVEGQLHATNIDEAQNLLSELGKPKGFEREMVVVGNRVYRSTGDEDVKFEEMDNPLDGLFMVKEYTPRLVCDNGRVVAIELLKSTGEEVGEDEFSMSQDLEDLAAMFQIEID